MYNGRFGHSLNQKEHITEPQTAEKYKNLQSLKNNVKLF